MEPPHSRVQATVASRRRDIAKTEWHTTAGNSKHQPGDASSVQPVLGRKLEDGGEKMMFLPRSSFESQGILAPQVRRQEGRGGAFVESGLPMDCLLYCTLLYIILVYCLLLYCVTTTVVVRSPISLSIFAVSSEALFAVRERVLIVYKHRSYTEGIRRVPLMLDDIGSGVCWSRGPRRRGCGLCQARCAHGGGLLWRQNNISLSILLSYTWWWTVCGVKPASHYEIDPVIMYMESFGPFAFMA